MILTASTLLGAYSLLASLARVSPAATPPPLNLDLSKSFRANLIIVVTGVDGGLHKYHLDEAFSSSKKRTKIRYKRLGANLGGGEPRSIPASGTLILEHEEGTRALLLADKSETSSQRCRQISPESLRESLQAFKSFIPIDSHGPSEVLLTVERLRDKLERVNMLPPSVRNVPSEMFQYKSGEYQLHVLYAKQQVDLKANSSEAPDPLAPNLPLRVELDPADGSHMEIDFLHFSELENGTGQRRTDRDAAEDYFDEFFIERAAGCSFSSGDQQSGPEESSNLFAIKKDGDLGSSFSFVAQVPEEFRGVEESTRVAYYGPLHVLRIERESASRRTSELIDFNQGTATHVLERHDRREEEEPLDKILVASAADTDGNTRSCVLLESAKRRPAATQLVAPAGRYIHLGEARIRGVWTRAHEAYNTTWPSWLEQATQYYEHESEAPSKRHQRIQDARENNQHIVLTTVVYLDAEDDRLVQVEIFRMDHLSGRVLNQITIPIHDFSWSPSRLDSAAFLLIGQCQQLAETGDKVAPKEHGRVALLLSGKSELESDWLQDSCLRDLALLESIQSNLKIPCTLIDDLSSRVAMHVVYVDVPPDYYKINLDVTFRFASGAKRSVAELTYRGKGQVKKLFQFKLVELERHSLASCFYLTAHRKLDTFFAYNRFLSLCLIDVGPQQAMVSSEADRRGSSRDPRAFVVNAGQDDGPLEIYFVSHEDKPNPSDLIAQLHNKLLAGSAVANSQLLMKMPVTSGQQADDDKSSRGLNLFVRSLRFLDANDDRQPFKVDDVSLEDTRSFERLALVPDGKLSHESPEALDLDACSASCLKDAACKSYSFCVRGSSSECVLSGANFKAGTSLLVQLIDILAQQETSAPERLRAARRYDLKLNDTHLVHLETRINCELHNKMYLDMFSKSEKRQNLGDFGSIEPVDGRDQCAQRCFEASLGVLHAGDRLLETTKSNLEQLLKVTGSPPSAEGFYDPVRGLARQAAKNMCKEFSYLDTLNLASLSVDLQARYHLSPGRLAHYDQARGYCLLTTRRTDERGHGTRQEHYKEATIELERYALKFEALYEKQRGVSLLASKRTDAELSAYRKLMAQEVPPSGSELEPLRDIVSLPKNSQTHMTLSHMDEATCASVCSTQALGPWPSCRSFDLIVTSTTAGDRPSAICLLNSITLGDALESNQQHLIDHSGSLTHMRWHYELRYRMESNHHGDAGPQSFALDVKEGTTPRQVYFGMPSAMIICVCLVGSLTGILMGLNLGGKYSPSRRKESMTAPLNSAINEDYREPYSLSIDAGSIDLRRMSP